MAKRKKTNRKKDETLVDLVEARDQAQGFLDQNRNLLFGGLTVLVVAIGGLFAYNNFIKKPKAEEALRQVWKAEQQFFQDSFALALTNPGGGYAGLRDIAEDYRSAPTSNAANYMAGISNLHLGQFQAAVSFLEDVKADGEILPIMKFGSLGDAYSELNDLDAAMRNYKKAVANGDNDALTPIYMMKVGLLHENQGNFGDAEAMYKRIKDEYPNSTQGRDIEKYLIRIAGK